MEKLWTITVLSILFLFSSCSCMRVLVGILVDRNTQQPIKTPAVQVINKGYERQFESDSTGYFKAYLQGGAKCPRIRARISAEGYTPINIIEPRNGDTLVYYMEKE